MPAETGREPDLQRAILTALSAGSVSGPTLAERFEVSRTAIWKQIESLREQGFRIVGDDGGYRIESVPTYGALAVEFGLEAPYTVEYHDTIESTNERARTLAREGRNEVVVLADEQTRGRGRTDREWRSPPGGIWASIVVQPTIPPARVAVLTVAGAVGIARAARETGVQARIKWPNDVVVADAGHEATGGRKLAGVLTEMEGEADRVAWAIVGLGVNANISLDDIPDGATSLRAEGADVDRRVFAQRMIEEFHALSTAPDAALTGWRELECTLGRRVRIDAPDGVITGTAVDITENGALVVDTGVERRTVFAGDCRHLRF